MIEFHGATAWPTYQSVLWVCTIVNMCILCMCSLQLCPAKASKLTVIFEIAKGLWEQSMHGSLGFPGRKERQG
jgi:hypothetical protein